MCAPRLWPGDFISTVHSLGDDPVFPRLNDADYRDGFLGAALRNAPGIRLREDFADGLIVMGMSHIRWQSDR